MQVIVDFVEESCRASLNDTDLTGTGLLFSTSRSAANPQSDAREPEAATDYFPPDDAAEVNETIDTGSEEAAKEAVEEAVKEEEEDTGGKVKFAPPEAAAVEDEVLQESEVFVEDQEDWKELPPQEEANASLSEAPESALPPPPVLDKPGDITEAADIAEAVPPPPEDATEEEAKVFEEVTAALGGHVGEGLAEAAQAGLDEQAPQDESIPPPADTVEGAEGQVEGKVVSEEQAEQNDRGALIPSDVQAEGGERQPRWSEAEERGSEEGGGEEREALEALMEEGGEGEVDQVEEVAHPESEEVIAVEAGEEGKAEEAPEVVAQVVDPDLVEEKEEVEGQQVAEVN